MTTPDPTEPDIVWAKRLARIACLWREGDADHPWTDIATALGKAREEGRREALASVIASLEDSAVKAQRFTQQQARPRSGTYDEGYDSGRLSALALVRWMQMTDQETRERSNG